jgi:predicted Holliday junction resolvase-like endonuclease
MNYELLLGIVIFCLASLLAISVYVAHQRDKVIKQLKYDTATQTILYKEMVDKHTTEMKEYFETKTKLVSEFKVIADKLREEKDIMKSMYEEKLEKLNATYLGELGHRKSSEVRLGRISESLAPFLDGWPWDPNNFRFLGNPIDGIQFNEDELIFVEIKTGKSRLSASQKWIKDLVMRGKVSFATFRITENGSNLIKENGNEG